MAGDDDDDDDFFLIHVECYTPQNNNESLEFHKFRILRMKLLSDQVWSVNLVSYFIYIHTRVSRNTRSY